MNHKRAAALLVKARNLMNNNGEHWIRRAFVKRVYENDESKVMFCSVGGLNHAAGRNHNSIQTKPGSVMAYAVCELANTIIADNKTETEYSKARFKMLLQGRKKLNPLNWEDVQRAYDVIINNNDRVAKGWEDIERVFTRTANRLALRAKREAS